MTGSPSGEKPRDSKVDRTSKKDQKAESRVNEKAPISGVSLPNKV
jgi:hypothetical protein